MYNHNKIEKKWQAFWEENQTYKFKENPNNKKFYSLDMFPYPSGKGLHVGHPKGYTATDIVARFKKLQGYDVLHPIGWDAFGLPAEQYAIETNNDPAEFTQRNIENFRNQLKKLGFCFDYSKEVNTTDPKYYKWTQWIFIKLFEHGLAELKDVEVNWCQELGTVLSNEEVLVDKDGNQVSERGGFQVEKKPMKQWVLKITNYADKLLEGLDELDWPESLKSLQRNWIGKTDCYKVAFSINQTNTEMYFFELDDIYNLEYVFISPKADILNKINLSDEQAEFVDSLKTKNDRYLKANKKYDGIELSINLVNPFTSRKIRFFVADFVAADYNFDIMGFNNSNEDCLEFIKKYKLDVDFQKRGVSLEKIQEKIPHCSKTQHFKLKDWLFSRQRYWGEPFPIVFDSDNKPHTISEDSLPLLLPKLNDFKPDKTAMCVLSKAKDWINVTSDNKHYTRDLNTMPQWAGSCWYYLGYLLKQENDYIPLNSDTAKQIFKKWLPVDLYIGGQEHAVLHLLYARFWHRFLYDIGVVPTKEPFQKIINQGMILGPDNEKMSKSKGNIISPDEIMETHGADALRMYEMFMGPLVSSMAWDTEKLNGVRKWLDRVHRLYTELEENQFEVINTLDNVDSETQFEFNSMVQKITKNIEEYQFNIAISNMMVFINHVYKTKKFYKPYMKDFATVLSIFAPHLAEELYSMVAEEKQSVFLGTWPKFDESILVNTIIKMPIMINKKPRDVLDITPEHSEEDIKRMVLESEKVKEYIKDKEILKISIIPNKIIIVDIKE